MCVCVGMMTFRVDMGLDSLPAANIPVPLHPGSTQLLRSGSCLRRASAKVAV